APPSPYSTLFRSRRGTQVLFRGQHPFSKSIYKVIVSKGPDKPDFRNNGLLPFRIHIVQYGQQIIALRNGVIDPVIKVSKEFVVLVPVRSSGQLIQPIVAPSVFHSIGRKILKVYNSP